MKKLKYCTKKELIEIIEVLRLDVNNLRCIVDDQNEALLMLYCLLEDNIDVEQN